MLRVYALLAYVALVYAAREEDRVTYLPGLDPQPWYDHYAGYLDVDGNNKFFYWFVESESETAADDPVVLWLNGGPGCSSLTGFLVELGPWRVDPSGESLSWFEHRWNKIANIIFMESPQCVGYSYSEDGNCATGDDQVAYDNHMALNDFFEGFPEYRDNDFYVTGESYAGIYVPTLASRLMDDENYNLKGFAVGNAVTDWDMMDNALVPFMWGRGVFGTDLYDDLTEHCCDWNATYCDYMNPDNSAQCRTLMLRVNAILWASGLNPYNLYDECFGGAPGPDGIYEETETSVRMVHPGSMPQLTKEARENYRELFRQKGQEKPEQYASIPCTDTSDRDTYLNNPEVREALHVPEFVQEWEACATLQYTYNYDTMREQFLKLIGAGHRGLVFNGDMDMACNHLGDMWFVESLDQPEEEGVDGEYKAWYYDDELDTSQIAGYVLQDENIKFMTVKGAGHFVPTDKPWPAYIMWENFLNDEPY